MLFNKYGGANIGVTNVCPILYVSLNPNQCENFQWQYGTWPRNWDYFMSFYKPPHYISRGANLLLSRSPIQYYLIVFTSILCWFENIYVWTSWNFDFWTLEIVLGGYPTGSRKNWIIFILSLSESNLTETNILWFQLSVVSQNKIFVSVRFDSDNLDMKIIQFFLLYVG